MKIEDFLANHNQAGFRLKQFNQARYQTLISNFSELTTWSKELRNCLIEEVSFSSLKRVSEQLAKKEDTLKVLFERNNYPGQFFETVLMMHRDGRNTVCVSCMVGCPLGCKFCATGGMGFTDSLTAEEIVDQVLEMARFLQTRAKKISTIDLMGMGEPLLNLDEVSAAIEVFTAPDKMAMSESRIVISTAGIIEALKKLISQNFKGRLAVSLHAPNQKLREQIMPIAKTNPLDKLMAVVDQYIAKTNKRVSFEYILIKNVNDKERHAHELVELIRNRLVHVNLIPYNQISGQDFTPPHGKQVDRFANILKKARIPHTVRVNMGDDIDAACGQLATKRS